MLLMPHLITEKYGIAEIMEDGARANTVRQMCQKLQGCTTPRSHSRQSTQVRFHAALSGLLSTYSSHGVK